MVIKRRSLFLGERPHRAQKSPGSIRQRSLPPVNQPQHSPHLQLIHRNPHQQPTLQLLRHRQMRNQRHPVAHGHKPLDSLDGRQLDVHIQWRPVALKCLNHFPPQRRGHVVRDKNLISQVIDRNPPSTGQRMLRAHNQRQAVGIDGDGAELRLDRDGTKSFPVRRCAGSAPQECARPASGALSRSRAETPAETGPWPAAGTGMCTHWPPVAAGPAPGSSARPARSKPPAAAPLTAAHSRAAARPAAVSEPSRAARSKSVSPTDASSLRITWLTAGCVRAAAPPPERSSAPPPRPEMFPSWLSSIIVVSE
jgi:hypothetical protein